MFAETEIAIGALRRSSGGNLAIQRFRRLMHLLTTPIGVISVAIKIAFERLIRGNGRRGERQNQERRRYPTKYPRPHKIVLAPT